MNDPVFDNCYVQVKKLINKSSYSQGIHDYNWSLLFTTSMQVVETVPNLTGTEKKELVSRLIHKIVNDSTDLDNTEKNILEILTSDEVMSCTIELIISAVKGEFNIKKAQKVLFKNCCSKK